MELKEIAEVFQGYAFRHAIESNTKGNIFIAQARGISHGGQYIGTDGLLRASYEISGYSRYLQKGDVLLAARGVKTGAFRSAVFTADTPNVVASSSLHVIRITTPSILPEYLSQYLNSPYGQKQITEIISGSYIGAISRKKLEELLIPIPHLNKQQAIIDLYRNITQQQKILDQRNSIKQKVINATFKHIITQ